MDFARKQLEKYGWSDGKGLGRHENGISEALRPKLKRSVTGLGHDAAAELNDHWWSSLYDQAARNVEVRNKTKISTKNANAFSISSSSLHIITKDKPGETHGFVRKAVLKSGGAVTERLCEESDSDDEVVGAKMTDEELFVACGGRTAHKGARHGLRASGKLSRIEEQERNLLKLPQYKGYSQAIEDNESIEKESERKKKRKSKIEAENTTEESTPIIETVAIDDSAGEKKRKRKVDVTQADQEIEECTNTIKKKKKKNKYIELSEDITSSVKRKKKEMKK